jgi:hypothetical protein
VVELIVRSREGESVYGFSGLQLHALRLSTADVVRADKYIRSHKDRSAYHLLIVLREKSRATYDELPDFIKAAILSDALKHVHVANDWTYLRPLDSYDSEAARALLETGHCALSQLTVLLDDKTRILIEGSEGATSCFTYKCRRADLAYRYICLLLRQQPVFHPEPKDRDKEIERLKAKLASTS